MNDQKAKLKDTLETVLTKVSFLKRYALIAFVVFVAGLYGFVLMRINNLSSQEPTADAVTTQVKAARIPHIDENVVKQIESLEDNSVSVQTLFEEARSNPFE